MKCMTKCMSPAMLCSLHSHDGAVCAPSSLYTSVMGICFLRIIVLRAESHPYPPSRCYELLAKSWAAHLLLGLRAHMIPGTQAVFLRCFSSL